MVLPILELLSTSLVAEIKVLRAPKRSLALALSEEATLPAGTPAPAAGQLPRMVASGSRRIALIGTVIPGTFFVGIGFYVVWQLCSGHSINMANYAWAFFVCVATMSLPDGVTKATSILSCVTPARHHQCKVWTLRMPSSSASSDEA